MKPTAYLRLPPGSRHVLVPTRPASAAALGTTLYVTSRPRALLAQRVLWGVTRVGGLRLVPGNRESWDPPFEREILDELHHQWARAVGGRIDALAVYERPQQHRAGADPTSGRSRSVALLVCAGPRSMLVRVRAGSAGFGIEPRLAEQARALGIDAFRVPELRADGAVGQWTWVGYEAISTRPHAAVTGKVADALYEQVGSLVGAVLPRPEDVPPDWRAAHGDLTPWNLRRAGSTRWLIDWEDARFAPPGADQTYFTVAAAAVRSRADRAALARLARYPQARRYWLDDLGSRPAADRDGPLIARMSALLVDADSATDR